jgi:hypothetical protein
MYDGKPKSRSPSNIGSIKIVIPSIVSNHPFISRYVSIVVAFVDGVVLLKCEENRGVEDEDDEGATTAVDTVAFKTVGVADVGRFVVIENASILLIYDDDRSTAKVVTITPPIERKLSRFKKNFHCRFRSDFFKYYVDYISFDRHGVR